MVGWHHRPGENEVKYALGVGDGQESLQCYGPSGREDFNTAERLN